MFRNLLRGKEKFLLLEILPDKTRGLLLNLDDEKKLTPEKFWDDFPLSGAETRKFQNLRKRKLIVSAHPSLIATVSMPVEFKRDAENFNQPLSSIEFETLFAQTIGKIFNHERKEASSRLGRNEIDTILVNAQVLNFKIDGHLILNPLGFPGKVVGAVLELTFTTREIFENLKNFFNASDGFFFTESARAGLRALSKIQAPPVNLIVLDTREASFFMLEKAAWGHVVRRKKIDWALSSILEAIASSLFVSHKVVLKLYARYLAGETSENFKRAFLRALKPEVEKLLGELEKSKLRGRAYLQTPMPMPFSLPAQHGRVLVDEIPLQGVLDKGGFRLDFSEWPLADSEIFMRLAPFFEFYYDKSDSEINHKLRRRLHWLIQ